MIVAYLVNQYPHVSHTFIRREIAALERRGSQVMRFSIRPAPRNLVDPADIAEKACTNVLLAAPLGVLVSTVIVAFSRPLRWLKALLATWRLGWRSRRGVLRHLAYLAEACDLLRRLNKAGVCHVHAHFGTNSATVALLCRLLGGPPFSFTVHGPEEFDAPESLSLGTKIEHAAFVAAISSFGRSQLYRWSRAIDWPKINVVRCGLDAEFLDNPVTPPPANQQFVCVGRLCEQKGQLLLVEALAQLKAGGITAHVVLAGDGPMRDELEARIREFGLTDQVCITGWVRGDEVRDLLRTSRALVLPSFAEGLPVVIMEAFALARPVLTTYIAGIPELVRDGENGWLFPAGDAAALAKSLGGALAATTEQLARMGEVGRAAVRAHHSADIEAGKLVELFNATQLAQPLVH